MARNYELRALPLIETSLQFFGSETLKGTRNKNLVGVPGSEPEEKNLAYAHHASRECKQNLTRLQIIRSIGHQH